MPFEKINIFLKKFYSFTPSDAVIKQAMVDIIKTECGITLPKHEVEMRRHTIYLRTTPAKKNEILLRKSVILERLKKQVGIHELKEIY